MSTPSFDLIDIIKTIQKKRRFIVIIMIIAGITGGIFHGVKKKKYKAEARFLVTNPLYGDRNNLFRSVETRFVDYFAGDDDLDRVTSLLNSDTVRDRIIRNCQFQEIYKSDINDPKSHAYLMSIFDKNFSLKRSEYKDMEVAYIAYNPQDAANVANMSVQVLEQTFRNYYSGMKRDMCDAIKEKVIQLDSNINILTDSLAALRDKYHIYSIISPARQNVISSDVKYDAAGSGKAIEELQNIESIKDQLVTDRVHDISLLNEFSVSESSALSYIKLITRALPPSGPMGFSLVVTVVICILVGMLFSICYVLLMAYYKLLISTEK